MDLKKRLGAGMMVLTVLMLTTTINAQKDSVLATVGSEKITKSEFEARISQFPKELQEEAKKKENVEKILDQMIDEKLLISDAKSKKIDKRATFKQQISDAQTQLLLNTYIQENIDPKVQVTEAEVRQYFDQNPNQFKEEEYRNADHILVKTEDEAKKLLEKAKAGDDFAKLAKENSIDPSAQNNNGALGWFIKGQMVPEFEQKVFGMTKGELGIVKSQFGVHVIRLNDTNVRPAVTFDQIKERIQESLTVQKKRDIVSNILKDLKQKTKISKK